MLYGSIEEKLETSNQKTRDQILRIRAKKENITTESIPMLTPMPDRIPDDVLEKIRKMGKPFVNKVKMLGIEYLHRLYKRKPALKDYIESSNIGGYKNTIKPKLKSIRVKEGVKKRAYSTSPGELEIERVLGIRGVSFEREKNFYSLVNPKTGQPLFFDFWLKEYNLVIEYDGKQHYYERPGKDDDKEKLALKSLQHRDSVKNKYCKDNKIRLLRIPYYDFFRIDDILNEHFFNAYKNKKPHREVRPATLRFQ